MQLPEKYKENFDVSSKGPKAVKQKLHKHLKLKGTRRLQTSVSELSYVSCMNYIMRELRIQFILPGKARQTFANFSANFHPNLTKIESICSWVMSVRSTYFRINTFDSFEVIILTDKGKHTHIEWQIKPPGGNSRHVFTSFWFSSPNLFR